MASKAQALAFYIFIVALFMYLFSLLGDKKTDSYIYWSFVGMGIGAAISLFLYSRYKTTLTN
jgi:hypothetical protein